MLKNSNNDILLLYVSGLFLIGILCLLSINYYHDVYLTYYKYDFLDRQFLSNKFNYECGIFLDFFVLGVILLMIWLKPEILKISFKRLLIERFKYIFRELKNYWL